MRRLAPVEAHVVLCEQRPCGGDWVQACVSDSASSRGNVTAGAASADCQHASISASSATSDNEQFAKAAADAMEPSPHHSPATSSRPCSPGAEQDADEPVPETGIAAELDEQQLQALNHARAGLADGAQGFDGASTHDCARNGAAKAVRRVRSHRSRFYVRRSGQRLDQDRWLPQLARDGPRWDAQAHDDPMMPLRTRPDPPPPDPRRWSEDLRLQPPVPADASPAVNTSIKDFLDQP